MEWLAIILFFSIFLLILYGFPVAFTLGGLSVIYALCFLDPAVLPALPSRIMGVMQAEILMAVPLFIFMGIMLEKSGLAERLLDTMALLLGKIRGGLAISVILVGTMLAASTGIVGATVVTMGLISLPIMLKRNYKPEIATGVIASAGTLGQIIPPSVMLVLLGSVLQESVGDLFKAALLPGLMLVGTYILYILILARLKPESMPAIPATERAAFMGNQVGKRILEAFLLPMLLITAVLGSIFMGYATPTEAAGVGALGATLLTFSQRKLDWSLLQAVMKETLMLTSMVFLILLGATTFSFVFRHLGGDQFILEAITNSSLSPSMFLLVVMVVVFVAGFFIDFIEIIFIVVPVVAPVFVAFDMDLIWIGILLAMNLQTSFLTPPFGFSLFYLKGVAPPSITTRHLYNGIIPFVIIQVVFLLVLALFPQIITWSINLFS
ncbi:MAG: TRAP transporter large permease subunit [Saprospiraceae bacterium]|nr:TRAP transporter large permease subunit [Saprospiraceae bacterium]